MCLGTAGGGTALLYASKGLVAGFKERGLIANFDQQVKLPHHCCASGLGADQAGTWYTGGHVKHRPSKLSLNSTDYVSDGQHPTIGCCDLWRHAMLAYDVMPSLPNLAWNRACTCVQVGLAALERAMQEPTRVIVDNAGQEGAVIVGKLLEGDSSSNIGYNAADGAPLRATTPAHVACARVCPRCQHGIVPPRMTLCPQRQTAS